jgi:hypothetical protein
LYRSKTNIYSSAVLHHRARIIAVSLSVASLMHVGDPLLKNPLLGYRTNE